jgi:hypothetical protein
MSEIAEMWGAGLGYHFTFKDKKKTPPNEHFPAQNVVKMLSLVHGHFEK